MADLDNNNDNFIEVRNMELASVILYPSSGSLTHLGRKGVIHCTCHITIALAIKI